MENIKISTTQNVDLEYVPAGVGYRILATLLDGIFVAVYLLALLLFMNALNISFTDIQGGNYFAITVLLIFLIPVFLYHFLFETFLNGQSLGKKVVGIKVVKLDGSQAGLSSYILRSLFRIIDISLVNGLVGLISIVVSEKSQRLGDMAAGTTVIKLENKVNLNDTILFKQIENYKIVFQQVEVLSDKDIAIIKEVMDYSVNNDKPEVLKPLAIKVKTKMGLTSTLTDELFLKTVLLDYSHFQFEK